VLARGATVTERHVAALAEASDFAGIGPALRAFHRARSGGRLAEMRS
jgi:hypothetical protein